jgi:hypothetical protein
MEVVDKQPLVFRDAGRGAHDAAGGDDVESKPRLPHYGRADGKAKLTEIAI